MQIRVEQQSAGGLCVRAFTQPCRVAQPALSAPACADSLELWGDLVSDFIRQVVGAPAVVAGNSIGAVTVLSAAYVDPALVRGIVLLNAAGRFDSDATPAPAATQNESGPSAALSELFRRVVSAAIFFSTKFRIAPILKTVYVNHAHVDAELVESIYAPACDPDALEAFFLISGSGGRSKRTLNELLRAGLNAPQGPIPMLLCWGMADPWMKPDKAQVRARRQQQRGAPWRLLE
jgi:pimeloyl-ACP methyl ester carboxylesterase